MSVSLSVSLSLSCLLSVGTWQADAWNLCAWESVFFSTTDGPKKKKLCVVVWYDKGDFFDRQTTKKNCALCCGTIEGRLFFRQTDHKKKLCVVVCGTIGKIFYGGRTLLGGSGGEPPREKLKSTNKLYVLWGLYGAG